jgi:hypothetical protein
VTTGTLGFYSLAGSSANVGSYAIHGNGLTQTNLNYIFEDATGNATALTVTPAVLTYNATAVSRTYGSSNPTFAGTVTGFVNSDTLGSATTGTAAFTSSATAASNTGAYAINGAGLTANNGNYTFAQAAGNSTALTINPAVLTYNATPVSRTYGASNPTFSGTVTGFVNSDTLGSATTGSAGFTSSATSASNAGSYAVTGAGLTANNGNYTFAQASGNATAFTINPAVLTYNATSASRTYGSANPSFSGSVTGFVNNDTLSSATSGSAAFTSAATASSNTGSYAINGSGLTASNYTFAQAGGNATALTVNPAVLTYNATPVSRTYGASNPTLTGTVTGFVNNDTLSSATSGTLSFFSEDGSFANVGSYLITGSGLTANNGNYTFAQASGNSTALTINPALLTYSATAVSRTYGASNPSFSGTVTGFVNNDTLSSATTGSAVFTSPASAASNTGSYAIDGAGLSANHGNYTFAQADGNASALAIDPALLTYTAASAARTYGASNPTFTGTVSGFVNGDTLSSATTGSAAFTSNATAASNAGSYAIDGAGLTANHGNYTFAQADGNASALTINPATLTYTAASAARTYGASNPTFTGTVSGFVNGQTLSSATTGTATFTSAARATTNVGSYAINGFGLTADHGNYLFTEATTNAAALTINPAVLTYTANPVSRAYGTANPVFSGSVSGFVNGQTLASATTGTASFTSPATTASAAGAYAVDGSGLTANHGNYVFTQAPGNATALTITAAKTAPAPTPTPTPGGASSVLTFAIGNTAGVQNSTPTFAATYTGPAIAGVNISSVLSSLTYTVTPSPISKAGIYTITATGTAPHGYTLQIAPGTLTIVAGTPQSLPSQLPVITPVLPALLPNPDLGAAGSLLLPANAAGLFQIGGSGGGNSAGAGPAPLAQSLAFGATTQPTTSSAGAKAQ